MEYLLFIAVIFGVFLGIILGWFLSGKKTKKEIETILKNEKDNYYANIKNKRSGTFNHLDLVKFLKERKDFYKNKALGNSKNTNHINSSKYTNIKNERDRYKKERDEAQNEHKDLLFAFNKNEAILKKINEIAPNILSKINQPKSTNFAEHESSNTNDLITDVKKENIKVVSSNDDIAKKEETKNFSDQTNSSQHEPNNLRSIIYFSIPDSNGSFNLENGKDRKDDNTFYSIEYGENDDYAGINYISGELDIRAIDSIDFYLLPVCEIENIEIRENASKIELVSPGKVIKKDNSWKIDPDHKVKIKFS